MLKRKFATLNKLAASTFTAITFVLLWGVPLRAQSYPWPRTWQSWVAPNPFNSSGGLRASFPDFWNNPSTWANISTQMEVFKTYLGLFHPDLTTAAQLTTLKNVLYGKEVAVETGGLRLGDALSCGDMMGENTWYSEYYGWVQPRLKRWIDIGGQITYITADHAFFYTYMLKDQNGQRACPDMSRADVIRELVDYFVSARNTLGTGVKFGVIESLGMWRISTGYGTYLPTADLTEVLDLSTFLDELQSEAASRNLSPPLTIDHFDEDFGFEGALYDGGYAYLDYGRILGAENVIKSRGMKAGVFVSALHDPNSSNYNASARDRTIQFMQGYFKTTAAPDKLLFQSAGPYPDQLGSEADTTYSTSLGLTFASIFHWATPSWLSQGEYRVLPHSTIIKVTGPSTYCIWDSWDNYLAAHGGNGDLSGLTGYGSTPRDMTLTGACVP